MTVIVRQVEADSLTNVSSQLHDAFVTAKAAIEGGQSVVFVVFAADLLGQGSIENAAVAGGLLGLMRAIAFEGGAKGWHVNVVATDRDVDPDADLLQCAGSITSLNGQVLNVSVGQFGKVIP